MAIRFYSAISPLRIITLIAFCFGYLESYGVTKTALNNGNRSWNTASCWSPSGIPAAGDDIIIPTGVPFLLNNTSTRDFNSLTIQSGGSLTSSVSSRLILRTSFINNGTFSMSRSGDFPTATFYVQPSYTCTVSGTGTFDFGNIFTSTSNGTLRFNFASPATLNIYGSINSGGGDSRFNDNQQLNFTLTFRNTSSEQKINADDDFDYPNIVINKGANVLSTEGSGTLEILNSLTCTSVTDIFQINGAVILYGDFAGSGYIEGGDAASITLDGSSANETLRFVDDTFLTELLILRTNSAISYLTQSSTKTLTVLNRLELADNCTFTLGTGTLNIGSDIYVDLGYLIFGSGSSFIGSSLSNLTIRGSDFGELNFSQATSESRTLNSLYLENQGLEWDLTTNLSIIDFIELGPITTLNISGGSTLTLVSTSSNTARVAPLIEDAVLSGNVSVQRYIQGGYRASRLMSSPVNTGGTYNLSELQNYIFVTGPQSGAGFDAPPGYIAYGATISQYSHTSAAQPDAVISIPNMSTTIIPGEGYVNFIRGNRNSTAGKVFPPYVSPEAVTLAFTGTINQGDIDYNVPFLSGNTVSNGFTLSGNPYPSPILWSELYNASTNIDPQMYFYNPQQKQYGMVDAENDINEATNVIAPGQGFLVKANDVNAILSFTENVKTVTPGVSAFLNVQDDGMLKPLQFSTKAGDSKVSASNKQFFKFRLVRNNTILFDEIVISIKPGSTKKYSREDGVDFEGSDLRLSSFSEDGKILGINYIPEVVAKDSVKLYVNAALPGNYSLKFTEAMFSQGDLIPVLTDKYLKKESIITKGLNYIFAIDISTPALREATTGSNRFAIVFKKPTPSALVLTSFTAKKELNGALLEWKTSSEYDNKSFILERSDDNKIYIELGNVSSTGSATAGGNYTFLDKNPLQGTNYYRLRQINSLGNTTFSQVVSLDWELIVASTENIKAYPIPTKDNLTINLGKWSNREVIISTYSIVGLLLDKTNLNISQNTGTHSTNLTNLAPGVYIVEVKESSSGEVQKIKVIRE